MLALGIIAAIAVVLGGILISTWLLMLVLGWVHSFADVVPAFSFWQTFTIVILLSLVGGFFRSASK